MIKTPIKWLPIRPKLSRNREGSPVLFANCGKVSRIYLGDPVPGGSWLLASSDFLGVTPLSTSTRNSLKEGTQSTRFSLVWLMLLFSQPFASFQRWLAELWVTNFVKMTPWLKLGCACLLALWAHHSSQWLICWKLVFGSQLQWLAVITWCPKAGPRQHSLCYWTRRTKQTKGWQWTYFSCSACQQPWSRPRC